MSTSMAYADDSHPLKDVIGTCCFRLKVLPSDNVLIPVQTAWFGFYPPNDATRVLPYYETELYEQDWIGLRSLDQQGKVAFVNSPGVHLNVTYKLLREVILPALQPPGSRRLPPPPEVAAPSPSQVVGNSNQGP
eukprot:TRINITY_DN20349_c0_g1_i1.p1 TRINITY_DN20349_c0_g1~~TRINITY_DN20349_c0_g1_i1.p1  ORF type:complete len:134 (+),score=16.03 TRINITY_DN20349_c0_g1_i1:92-493(+)